jgi:hypothetical protein
MTSVDDFSTEKNRKETEGKGKKRSVLYSGENN